MLYVFFSNFFLKISESHPLLRKGGVSQGGGGGGGGGGTGGGSSKLRLPVLQQGQCPVSF